MSAAAVNPETAPMALSPQQHERIALLKQSAFFEMAATDACFACGGQDFSIFAEHDRYGFPLRYVSCRDCGFLFANPYYTNDCLDRFYTEHYSLIYGRASLEAQCFNEFFHATQVIVPFLKHRLPKTGAVMDYGCANGGALLAIPGQWHKVGFDYDDEQLARGRSLGLDLLHVDAFISCTRHFDLIMMNQVLEHAPDPVALLKRIAPRLTQGGLLYIEVPGFQEVFDRSLDPRLPFKNAHRHLFCLDTLARVAARAGLELIEGDEKVRAVFRRATTARMPTLEGVIPAAIWLERLASFSPGKARLLTQLAAKLLSRARRLKTKPAFNRALATLVTQRTSAPSSAQ